MHSVNRINTETNKQKLIRELQNYGIEMFVEKK